MTSPDASHPNGPADVARHDITLSRLRIDGARLRSVEVSGADIRGSALHHSRLRGVELMDVQISGELQDVTVNGVDIAPLVEAELNRRMPERAKMRPRNADGFREAWAILQRLWRGTLERAERTPEVDLHRRVGDEWSFIETLRHLDFASAAWVERMYLGIPSPWHPLDLPWEEAPGWAGIPWDRDVRPTLREVLAMREARQATIARTLADLTDTKLAGAVSRTEPGWPCIEHFPVRECFLIVLNEEWEHRLYAERDLNRLGADV